MNAQDLKNSILQLAVQGKLVDQRPEEGTAKELLAQIKAEKEQLIKEKKIKKAKPLPEITEDDIPFEIPASWEWVRLGTLSSVITKGTTPRGGNVSYLDSGIGFLRAENVAGFDCLIKDNMKYINFETHTGFLKRSVIECNDILITIAGTLGRTGLVRQKDLPLNANQAIAIIRLVNSNIIDLKYLIYAINAPHIHNILMCQKKITAIPNLTLEIIANCIVALPPLAEQKRIVAKIEEILPYIEQYDKVYTKLETLNKKFPEDMKKSILQIAMQGKLVDQRAEEGTADELYEQIVAEKAMLIKKGKIKKEKPLPEITEDEIPFEIPSSWKWVRFGEFGSYKKGPFGSALTKGIFVPKGEDTVKVYEQKNAIQKDASLGEYYITREYFESKMKGFELFPGDIIVSCAGTIGETYIMPEGIEQGIINQALMRMKLMPSVYVEYFLLYFDVTLKQTARKSSKGSAIKNIPPFDELKSYLVPLPPLAEQKRIVAKIEEILPYCDQLLK